MTASQDETTNGPGDRGPAATRRTRALRFALVTTLALLGVAGGAVPASAAFPGYNGLIAFTRTLENANTEIYTMAADGSGQKRVTTNDTFDDDPAWSPDGSRIAFHSRLPFGHQQIYTIAPDGSGLTNRTNSSTAELQPSWSPDGRQIAFYSDRDYDLAAGIYGGIYTMAADGSAQTRRTTIGDDPAWSPDGRRITFTNDEIYTMAADGSAPTAITNNDGLDFAPDWQPLASAPANTARPVATPTGATTPRPGGAVPRVPVVAAFSLTRSAFCVGRRCPRSRRGTVLRFGLSAAARVEFSIERRMNGRRAGGRCTRATRRNRRGRRCSYYAKAGSFSRPAPAGANSVPFSGRIDGRALQSGSYRLSLTATGASGARSAVARIRFRVHRPATARAADGR